MIHPLDGPAAGQVLMLRSAPDFLRIVKGPKGFDGLDQWDDRPEPDETIHVYRRVSPVHTVHINARPKFCGFVAAADYRHVEIDGERVRDQVEWSKFVRSEPFEEPSREVIA